MDYRDIVAPVREGFQEERRLRNALLKVPRLLRERNPESQREIVARDIAELMDPDVIRVFKVTPSGRLQLVPRGDEVVVPPSAAKMEQKLLERAAVRGMSLLSSHPQLDEGLADLAKQCADEGLIVQVLPVSARGVIYGAFVAHWITKERPEEERRMTFYSYFGLAQAVLASTSALANLELRLAELHQHAYFDKLTGLPSGLALDEQLRHHQETTPLSVLSLDFDGMREANSAFGYTNGGDVLIQVVGRALDDMTQAPEFAARQHSGGDEFAVILPGVDASVAAKRAEQIERQLDTLVVPDTHRHICRGASVGHASRLPGEEPGQTLGRAIEAMTERKRVRRAAQAKPPAQATD